jgi:hypothetical protein
MHRRPSHDTACLIRVLARRRSELIRCTNGIRAHWYRRRLVQSQRWGEQILDTDRSGGGSGAEVGCVCLAEMNWRERRSRACRSAVFGTGCGWDEGVIGRVVCRVGAVLLADVVVFFPAVLTAKRPADTGLVAVRPPSPLLLPTNIFHATFASSAPGTSRATCW